MKYFLIVTILVSTLFSANITLANSQDALNKSFMNLKKELKQKKIVVTVFNKTKIYKNNGALLGLMKKNIDIAVVENKFLQSLLDEKLSPESLKKINFLMLKKGKEYSLVTHTSYVTKFNQKTRESLLDIINKELKEF